MHWFNEHLGSLALVGCSLSALVLVYSWGDGVSPLTVVKRTPSALRLVAGGLFLVGTGNFVMVMPGVLTGIAAEHWLGGWGLLFAWPGILFGFYLLLLIHKRLLAAYYFIAGVEED
jgi:hypothetical protein